MNLYALIPIPEFVNGDDMTLLIIRGVQACRADYTSRGYTFQGMSWLPPSTIKLVLSNNEEELRIHLRPE